MISSRPENVERTNFERSSGVISLSVTELIPDFSVIWPEGEGREKNVHQKFRPVREQVFAESHKLISPEAVWARVPAADARRIVSPSVSEAILDTTTAFFGVICTIGGDLDERVQHYFQKHESVRGYFLDQVGSIAVAALAWRVAEHLCNGFSALRWAPGDYDKDRALKAQDALFRCVPGDQVGVELTAHNVMKPTKSLSYMLLVGAEVSRRACTIDCASCVWNGRCQEQRSPVA